jgi:uncharacterized membrane protein (UPF0127 family)
VSYLNKLQPCRSKNCPIYESTKNAKLMLEVNAGMIDKENIEIGDFIKLIPSL